MWVEYRLYFIDDTENVLTSIYILPISSNENTLIDCLIIIFTNLCPQILIY